MEGKASFTSDFEKMRSGRTPFALRADLVPGPVSGSLCWDCTSDGGGLARTLSEGFKGGRWATQDEAAEVLDVSPAKISRTVTWAIREEPGGRCEVPGLLAAEVLLGPGEPQGDGHKQVGVERFRLVSLLWTLGQKRD